jgi:hypothetical protein
MINWNNDMAAAPKDGTMLLLWCNGVPTIGSWRKDDNCPLDDPLWLDNSYDDFSCGYASRPLKPSHWSRINEPQP